MPHKTTNPAKGEMKQLTIFLLPEQWKKIQTKRAKVKAESKHEPTVVGIIRQLIDEMRV